MKTSTVGQILVRHRRRLPRPQRRRHHEEAERQHRDAVHLGQVDQSPGMKFSSWLTGGSVLVVRQ